MSNPIYGGCGNLKNGFLPDLKPFLPDLKGGGVVKELHWKTGLFTRPPYHFLLNFYTYPYMGYRA